MSASYRRDLLLLLLFAAIVLAAGIGLRDPWPADEPRFALIAKDMVEGGSWLIPRIGGVLYPDKPPLFFWLVASVYALTGSLRIAILAPGLLSGLCVLLLVTDLARRLWDERTAIFCGATLLALLQFPLQMKSGQIDALLCLWTTLGMYGFARHLLAGPDWRWYTVGGLAAGLGVITKGVGFLPYLLFVPYAWGARYGWPVLRHGWRDRRWLLAPVATLAIVAAWLVPVLLVTGGGGDPDMISYRDDILFHQTVTRYANAWGHIRPPWYLFTHAAAWLWMPVTLLLPWLLPAWRRDVREKNAAVLVIGTWVLLVLAFFSLSAGKRSLYIFPAAPALALVAGLHARALLQRAGVQRMLVAIPAGLGALIAALAMYALMNPHRLGDWVTDGFMVIRVSLSLLATGGLMLLVLAVTRRRWVRTGYAASMAVFWTGLGVLVAPQLDAVRSGRALMEAASSEMRPGEALALVDWPEQFLLQSDQPVVHFGYRRDNAKELADASEWLAAAPGRRVLVPEHLLEPCFSAGNVVALGRAHRRSWYLADAASAGPGCAGASLHAAVVIHYPASGAESDGRL